MPWRYDRRDFGGHCRKGKSGEYRKACKALKKHGGFNATNLAVNLYDFIQKNKPEVKAIYFAATPQDAKLVREIHGNITKIDSSMEFYGHDELDEFIKASYEKCESDRMKLQIHDFLVKLKWSFVGRVLFL